MVERRLEAIAADRALVSRVAMVARAIRQGNRGWFWFSALGDVLLEYPADLFVFGLGSFLLRISATSPPSWRARPS